MEKVHYTETEGIVVLNTFGVVLRFSGIDFPYDRWVVSADVFGKLKAQNPDVEFVSNA
jgi:hypothetical protein